MRKRVSQRPAEDALREELDNGITGLPAATRSSSQFEGLVTVAVAPDDGLAVRALAQVEVISAPFAQVAADTDRRPAAPAPVFPVLDVQERWRRHEPGTIGRQPHTLRKTARPGHQCVGRGGIFSEFHGSDLCWINLADIGAKETAAIRRNHGLDFDLRSSLCPHGAVIG